MRLSFLLWDATERGKRAKKCRRGVLMAAREWRRRCPSLAALRQKLLRPPAPPSPVDDGAGEHPTPPGRCWMIFCSARGRARSFCRKRQRSMPRACTALPPQRLLGVLLFWALSAVRQRFQDNLCREIGDRLPPPKTGRAHLKKGAPPCVGRRESPANFLFGL